METNLHKETKKKQNRSSQQSFFFISITACWDKLPNYWQQ